MAGREPTGWPRLALAILLGFGAVLSGCADGSRSGSERAPAGEDTASTVDSAEVPEDSVVSRIQYQCDGLNLEATVFAGEAVRVTLPGRDLRLPQVVAASGTRYAEGDDEFWSRGMDEALLTLDGGEQADCSAIPGRFVWAEARDRGVSLRVAGNEPGWYAEVFEGERPRMVLVLDYGERELTFAESAPLDDGAGFRAVAEGDSVILRVRDEPCSDSMSGWSYPLRADLTVNEQAFSGCGRTYGSAGSSVSAP